ncbi:MAG TPA: xanthine dehydrogenase family protein molybdopterin-binding subunit [Acidimicrobiia bacterium]|nr:xanthine dehydrogenase family protein molybdopterin-binding subunit [Acidimicrobiia bacterium]
MDPTQRDLRFVTGTGRYLADLVDDSTLHSWFVRSPVAHARVVSIDTAEAEKIDSVVGVFTASDLELQDLPGNTGVGPAIAAMDRPLLARDRVRFVGDIVAVVVARSPAAAEDAAALVWVDYEDLGAVTTVAGALAGETLLFDGAATNVATESSLAEGPINDGVPEVSVSLDLWNNRLAPVSIEPLSVLARFDGDDLVLHCGHQAPHRLQRQIQDHVPGLAASVRVISPDVGGAFGMKGMLFPEYLIVPALARRLDAPVVWMATRRENMMVGTHGRAQRHQITLEGSADGDFSRLVVDIVADVGAYPHNGSQIPLFTRLVSAGLYRIPRVEVRIRTVVTNTAPIGSYRGAGRPEAAYALERIVDEYAVAAGIGPDELRRRNLITELPHRSPTGALYDSGDYHLGLDRLLEALDVDSIEAEKHVRKESGGRPLGFGMAGFVERAGGAADSGEYAKVEVEPGGRIVVRTGSTDQGQSHDRIWSRLVGDEFGAGTVEVISGDTATVADGVGTYGSRSAQVGGSAAVRVSRAVIDIAKERAARHLEAAAEDLVFEHGMFSVVGSPGSEVSIFDLVADDPLESEEMYVPGAQTFPYGFYGVVVEVDPESGTVTPLRVVAVDDCGIVLDQAVVHGQLIGSIAQGLGQALMEEVVYSPDGQLQTSTLMDYMTPRAEDMPVIHSERLVHPAPSNPLGAKGAGEAGCIGLPPAIVNATLDALRPLGVTHLDMPLSPTRVWAAIQKAGSIS